MCQVGGGSVHPLVIVQFVVLYAKIVENFGDITVGPGLSQPRIAKGCSTRGTQDLVPGPQRGADSTPIVTSGGMDEDALERGAL